MGALDQAAIDPSPEDECWTSLSKVDPRVLDEACLTSLPLKYMASIPSTATS